MGPWSRVRVAKCQMLVTCFFILVTAAGPLCGHHGDSYLLRGPLCCHPPSVPGEEPVPGCAPMGLLCGVEPGGPPDSGSRAERCSHREGGPGPHGRGLPVLLPGVLRTGAGGVLETPQPHPAPILPSWMLTCLEEGPA
uniref:Tetraspanin 32 n=1 Tax=Homo sapiens TaxID=9606 RepID=F8WB10_HUMAN